MKPVILGAGLLGSEIARQSGWPVLCREIDGIDITDTATYESKIAPYSRAVNCIGYTQTNNRHKEPAWSVNFVGVIDLVNVCNKHKIKLIHISTDYIYTNSVRKASEMDIPVHYNNWYTYSKLLADGYIQAKCNDYLLIRTSFKPRPYPWNSAWPDLLGNFDYVDVITSLIIKLIKINASGVYNVGTREKTMFDLANETKKCPAQRRYSEPHDITMDLTRMKNKLNE